MEKKQPTASRKQNFFGLRIRAVKQTYYAGLHKLDYGVILSSINRVVFMDARTLTIQPWEKTYSASTKTAIIAANIE